MALGENKKGVGASSCKTCVDRPGFEVLPCHHTTCYNCYISADDALLGVCGICHQHIESIVELKTTTPVVDKLNADWSTPQRGLDGSSLDSPVKADLRKKLEDLGSVGDPLFSLAVKTKSALCVPSQPSSTSTTSASAPQLPSAVAMPFPNMTPPHLNPYDSPSRENQPYPPMGAGRGSLPQFTSADAPPFTVPPVHAPMPTQPHHGFTYSQAQPQDGFGQAQRQVHLGLGHSHHGYGQGQTYNGYGHAQTHGGHAPDFTWSGPYNGQQVLVQAPQFNAAHSFAGMHQAYGPMTDQYGTYDSSYNGGYGGLGAHNGMTSPLRPQVQQYPVDMHPKTRERRSSDVAELIRTGALNLPDEDPATDDRSRNTRRNSVASISPQRSTSRARSSTLEQAVKKLQSGSTSIASTTKEGDFRGNTIAFLALAEKPVPEWFMKVIQGGYNPTVKEVFDSLPVVEACRLAAPSNAGVIVIRNIPYSTPRSEITAFVGRNALVVGQPEGSPYFGVHVIMDRHSGKTMDSFVEFTKASEAIFVVNTLHRRVSQGRPPKIGDRIVEVEISSQEELMETLFPRAKNVVWEGAIPKVIRDDERFYQGISAAGFTGFLQDEEIVLMTKHAETPQRSPFAQRCMIRCYESLISTLHKYPWYAIDHIYMGERNSLYDATYATVRALVGHLRRSPSQVQNTEPNKPTHTTLQELIVAVMTCPGFSEKQKSAVIAICSQGGFGYLCTSRGMNLRFGGVFPLANHWPFRALVKNPQVSDQLLDYFAGLIRQGSQALTKLTLVEQHAIAASGAGFQPFGHLDIDYGTASTMAHVGRAELTYVEKTLRRALEGPPAADTPQTLTSDVFSDMSSRGTGGGGGGGAHAGYASAGFNGF